MSGEKSREADLEPKEAADKTIPMFFWSAGGKDRLVMVDREGQEWPW